MLTVPCDGAHARTRRGTSKYSAIWLFQRSVEADLDLGIDVRLKQENILIRA
jgi:hypothetical protein